MFTVNKELLPVKLTYFLKFSVAGMQTFNPLLARQKGVPPEGVGLIWSLFPWFIISTMMIITNLADRFNTHRVSFIIVLITFLAAEAMLCFGPHINRNEENEYTQMDLNLNCQNSEFVSISNINEPKWLLCQSDIIDSDPDSCLSECSIEPNVNLELNAELHILINNTLFNLCADPKNNSVMIENISLDNHTEHLSCQEDYRLKCLNKCSIDQSNVKTYDMSMLEIIKYASFWLLLIALVMFECTNSITSSFCDTAALQLLGDDSHKFGLQRVWGTIGWGIMALVYGAAIDYFSQGGHRNYSAGYIISMLLWVLAFISATRIKFVNSNKKEKDEGSVFDVLNSFKVMIFMLCILVIGLSLGFVWTFLFLLIEDVANDWEPGFANLNFLQGLCLSIGCFVGEVPTMFFSGAVIEYIGNVHIFTLTLAIISTRFIIYFFIRNPWFFVPVEILHGISFGLFYPNMSAYASKVAPPGRNATMQGLVISMLNVGTSLGALIGGAGFKFFGGAQMFLYVGIADLFFMTIYVICHMLLNRRTNASGKFEEERESTLLKTKRLSNIDGFLKEDNPEKSYQVAAYGTMDMNIDKNA